MSARAESVLVIVPTYNESVNLPLIARRLFAAVPHAHLLVVDDASPDGTGELADDLAAGDERVHVLHRSGKLGLGTAYLQGFAWGMERGYSLLVEMDADGSHPPETLPAMLESAGEPDARRLVIGSRWTRGGAVENWPKRREVLSRGANIYTRTLLRIPVKDATAGFRVYPAEILREVLTTPVEARGYFFQILLTVRAIDAGFEVVEVPILFREREHGVSKMSGAIIYEAMTRVALLGAQRLGRRRSPAAESSKPLPPGAVTG